MKRYIVEKSALNVLNITTLDAMTELGSNKIITNEPLEYKNIPYLSIILTDEQVKTLNNNKIFLEEEDKTQGKLLAENTGYEKIRSFWHKEPKRAITGKGCKVGVFDSGCNNVVVPFDFGINFIDGNTNVTDIFGHGTRVCSIIKHPIIAVAPDCELHVIKVISDAGNVNGSAILAGIDYAIDNNLDIVNFSWTADSISIRTAVAELVATNCIISAASGNSSLDDYTVVPATLPGVVAVNAIDINGNPGFRNIVPFPGITDSHGVTVACNGVSCQSYDKNGNYAGCWGTSCAAPFFTGVFALYKEQLGISDNKRILKYILNRAKKTKQPNYFGVGLPTF